VKTALVTLNRYTCGECTHQYEALENISGMGSYGLLNARGLLTDQPAIGEVLLPPLDDVWKLVSKHSYLEAWSERGRESLRGVVFTLVADPLPSGDQPVFGIRPRCSRCSARAPKSWTECEPTVSMPVPVVEFTRWASLSSDAKSAAIVDVLKLITSV
jgi:hypothetical protein